MTIGTKGKSNSRLARNHCNMRDDQSNQDLASSRYMKWWNFSKLRRRKHKLVSSHRSLLPRCTVKGVTASTVRRAP